MLQWLGVDPNNQTGISNSISKLCYNGLGLLFSCKLEADSVGAGPDCRAAPVCCAQFTLLWCHWFLVVKYLSENLAEPRAERCTFVLVNSDQLRFVSYLLVSAHLLSFNSPLHTDTLLILFFLLQQRTASLSQLPVDDLRDPLPPHWRCYMSPQGRRYYVNTASNGKVTVCVHC